MAKAKLSKKTQELMKAAGIVTADSEEGQELMKQTFLSTGHAALDYEMGGGIPIGQMTLIAGWEGTLKTSFALHLAAQIQKVDDRDVYYFDGENALVTGGPERFGVDTKRLKISKNRKGELLLDSMQAVATDGLPSMMVIDSVKSFGMEQEIEKDASAYNIGIKAMRFGNKMNVIAGFAAMHKITVVVINQFTEDPGEMFGDGLRLSGGNWQKYLPFLRIDLTKSDKKENKIYDAGGTKVGQKMICRIKKSKASEFEAKEPKKFNFYYIGGLNYAEGLCSLAMSQGLISGGAGGFYKYKDTKINGKANIVGTFVDDAELFMSLEKEVNEILEQRKCPYGCE